jgi:formylglycine-generating enzyme required for sulfatase activity
MLTTQMIPKNELLSKPIKLRNACIFYLGHIPTFLDIHISRAVETYPDELEYYQKIFERGIDPDVDNPELCHAHSEIPDDWPAAEEILRYQAKVRKRVESLFASGDAINNPSVRKALWLGFEHEAMHLETLLYMLIQSDSTLPPAGVVVPDFESLSVEAEAKASSNEWVKIPAQAFTIGLDDPDNEPSTVRYYGWDNEKPRRLVQVGPFMAKSRPITNREYVQYLEESGFLNIPASWIEVSDHCNSKVSNGITNGYANGNYLEDFVSRKAVRTVFGRVPLKYALDWPVMASYDELAGCASWLGGRIPTMEEVRSIYHYVEQLKASDVQNRTETIPAVNSHLVNNGVEETPPDNSLSHLSSAVASSDQSTLFIDLQGANVGFKAWHPVPVTAQTTIAGQAELGGVWEWTSTVLQKHEEFVPMALYPGYTGR